MPTQQVMAYLTGLAGLGTFWLILLIATKKHPGALVTGEDGRPSTSKFQLLVWTAAVVFAFLAIYQIQFSSGYHGVVPSIPANLLIAMGISVASAVSAKSIAVKSQAKADAAKAKAADDAAAKVKAAAVVAATAGLPAPAALPNIPAQLVSQSGIFADDSGAPDLGKVQVILWTVIAVGVFLSKVFAIIHCPGCPYIDPQTGTATYALGLPDIDQTLMILMGLGHGAYIGKKIAES
jgi:hypothetical protein